MKKLSLSLSIVTFFGLNIVNAKEPDVLTSENGKLSHPVLFVHGFGADMTSQFGVMAKPLDETTFIPTQENQEYTNTKAEVTREGGWDTYWGIPYYESYRFKTGFEIELYMDAPDGGWVKLDTDDDEIIHWFPSVDCDDIDWDFTNCTPTVRDNLKLVNRVKDGVEVVEVYYDGYHSNEEYWLDATSNFYKSISITDLLNKHRDKIQSAIKSHKRSAGLKLVSALDEDDVTSEKFQQYSVAPGSENLLDLVYEYDHQYAPHTLAEEFGLDQDPSKINENGIYFFNSKVTGNSHEFKQNLCEDHTVDPYTLLKVSSVNADGSVGFGNVYSAQIQVVMWCNGISKVETITIKKDLLLLDRENSCDREATVTSTRIDQSTNELVYEVCSTEHRESLMKAETIQAGMLTDLIATNLANNERVYTGVVDPILTDPNKANQTTQLLNKIQWILTKPEWIGKKIDLVGYSMGGLVIRDLVHFLKQEGSTRSLLLLNQINQIVTYDTPNLGTVLATSTEGLTKQKFHPDAVGQEDKEKNDFSPMATHINDLFGNSSLLLADFERTVEDQYGYIDLEMDVKITGPMLGPYEVDMEGSMFWNSAKRNLDFEGPVDTKTDLQKKRSLGAPMAWKSDEGKVVANANGKEIELERGSIIREFDRRPYPTYGDGTKIRWTTMHGESAGSVFSQVPKKVRDDVEKACRKEFIENNHGKIRQEVYDYGKLEVDFKIGGDSNGDDPGGFVGIDADFDIPLSYHANIDLDPGAVCEKLLDGFVDSKSIITKKLNQIDKDWSFKSDMVVENFSQKGEKKNDPDYNKALNSQFRDKKLSEDVNIHIEMKYLAEDRKLQAINRGCDLVSVLAQNDGCQNFVDVNPYVEKFSLKSKALARVQLDEVETKLIEHNALGNYKIGLRYNRIVAEPLNRLRLMYYFNANPDLDPTVTTNSDVSLSVEQIKQNLHRVLIEKEVSLEENETSEPIVLEFRYANGALWNLWNDWSSSIYKEWSSNRRVQIVDENDQTVAGIAPNPEEEKHYTSHATLVASLEDRFTSENHTKPGIRVHNVGETTVNGFELNYFIKSSTKPEIEQYWANQMEKSSLVLQELEDEYWAVVIKYTNITLKPGDFFDDIDFEYHLPGHIPMYVLDDPSYSTKGIETINFNIPVYTLEGDFASIIPPKFPESVPTKLAIDSYENSNSVGYSNPILRVRHLEGDPLTGFIIYYRFLAEESNPIVDQWNLEGCLGDYESTSGGEHLVKITCENDILEPGAYFPSYTSRGDQGLSFALHYSHWKYWNKLSDYSYAENSNSYAQNERVWITDLKGNLLGGNPDLEWSIDEDDSTVTQELAQVEVDSYENSSAANFSNPVLRLRHVGGSSVNGFEVFYQFSSEEAVQVNQGNLEGCTGAVEELGNSQYLEVIRCENKLLVEGGYFPDYTIRGDQGINFTLHLVNWSYWNSVSDYSALNVNDYQHNSKIWVKDLKGNLIGGDIAP